MNPRAMKAMIYLKSSRIVAHKRKARLIGGEINQALYYVSTTVPIKKIKKVLLLSIILRQHINVPHLNPIQIPLNILIPNLYYQGHHHPYLT